MPRSLSKGDVGNPESSGLVRAAPRTLITRLKKLRRGHDGSAAQTKRSLLRELATRRITSISDLKSLHQELCFCRAFPADVEVLQLADGGLASFGERVRTLPKRVRARLVDTGIAETDLCFEYSYDIACVLADLFPRDVQIDWRALEDEEPLHTLLELIGTKAEEQTFDDGLSSARSWIALAKGDLDITDYAWLIRQCRADPGLRTVAPHLFDAAPIPVVWTLRGPRASRTLNHISTRRRPGDVEQPERRTSKPARDILSPLPKCNPLPLDRAAEVIASARLALAVRHREVYATTHANVREVYLVPVGRGVEIAVIGVEPARRLSIEANYGYFMFARGVPVGYGGVSPLFAQANTGVNIFEEYRGGDSAMMFTQTLRVFHHLFGTSRFVVNAYQFGGDNAEAVASGALWFYYKLGFRPVDRDVRRLAAREFQRLRTKKGSRTPATLLRKLACGDLELVLQKGRVGPFDESWLSTIAQGVTRLIAMEGCQTRKTAVRRIVRRVADDLRAGDRRSWPATERASFARLAPVVALVKDLATWPAADRTSLVKLMRAKGRPTEREYAHKLSAHVPWYRALLRFCRKRRSEMGRPSVERWSPPVPRTG